MTSNIFRSKRNKLGRGTKDALAQELPLLYKAYDKLLQKADPFNYEMTCSLDELAKFLGYKVREVQSIIGDLAKLQLISYEINEEENQYKIRLLVH